MRLGNLFLGCLAIPASAAPAQDSSKGVGPMARLKTVLFGATIPELPELEPAKTNTFAVSHPLKPDVRRADAIKEAFRHAWNGYYTKGFPHDEVQPVSGAPRDSRNGWGASAVDALSTAIIMEEKKIVNQILEYVPKIRWDYNPPPPPPGEEQESVSLFETTIRYLGGLISGYDFLNKDGPLKHLADSAANVEALMLQAMLLANKLRYAFDTPSGVPYNHLYPPGYKPNQYYGVIAEIGTLVLEWTRLSDITGVKDYGERAQRAEQYLLNPRPNASEPWPGLVGTRVSIDNGMFLDNSGSWSGGDDSFYEYLMKMYVYDPKRFGFYRERWEAAAQSAMRFLAVHPQPRPDLTFLAEFQGRERIGRSQHLTCFDGGSFLLGGSVLGKQEYIDFGLKLAESCYHIYEATATGIGPEAFAWDPRVVDDNQRRAQAPFFEKNGFYITSPYYILRPEVLESIYYAYRMTGDSKYQDMAWSAFTAINETCRVQYGFSSLTDVNAPNGGSNFDLMESFFFAETLKYLYLIFAPEAEWQVGARGGKNKWVFNTEAHPFKVFGS